VIETADASGAKGFSPFDLEFKHSANCATAMRLSSKDKIRFRAETRLKGGDYDVWTSA
jgi:hypothetical protein